MKHEIGQVVWLASFEARTSYVTCPDCGGTGRLRVTFHDETQVSIECRNCSAGFDPPTGRVKVYDREPRAIEATITGAEIDGDKVEWRTNCHWRVPENEIFSNRADALFAAREKARQLDREERERVNRKEKDTRTWAWNASYHRRCIKEAQRQLEYHSAKLAVAVLKSKEDKATAVNQ